MKLSTARRLVCMSYFTVDGLRPLLATATRIVCSGDTKRFLFPDGSVIESNKGHWKVIGMEKNSKLEAAVRRFGNGQKLPDRPFGSGMDIDSYGDDPAGFVLPDTARLQMEVIRLQELCNEKDEQIDALTCGKVKRIDWSVYAIIGLVIVAIMLGLRLP